MNDMLGSPVCPLHGDLALRLARGLLDDAAGCEAEAAVASCADCSAWLEGLLEGQPDVSMGVAAGLTAFRPPRRRLRPLVAGLAAMLVMAAGTGVIWHSVGGHGKSTQSVVARRAGSTEGRRVATKGPHERDVLFKDNMESGTLSAWVVHE